MGLEFDPWNLEFIWFLLFEICCLRVALATTSTCE